MRHLHARIDHADMWQQFVQANLPACHYETAIVSMESVSRIMAGGTEIRSACKRLAGSHMTEGQSKLGLRSLQQLKSSWGLWHKSHLQS